MKLVDKWVYIVLAKGLAPKLRAEVQKAIAVELPKLEAEVRIHGVTRALERAHAAADEAVWSATQHEIQAEGLEAPPYRLFRPGEYDRMPSDEEVASYPEWLYAARVAQLLWIAFCDKLPLMPLYWSAPLTKLKAEVERVFGYGDIYRYDSGDKKLMLSHFTANVATKEQHGIARRGEGVEALIAAYRNSVKEALGFPVLVKAAFSRRCAIVRWEAGVGTPFGLDASERPELLRAPRIEEAFYTFGADPRLLIRNWKTPIWPQHVPFLEAEHRIREHEKHLLIQRSPFLLETLDRSKIWREPDPEGRKRELRELVASSEGMMRGLRQGICDITDQDAYNTAQRWRDLSQKELDLLEQSSWP